MSASIAAARCSAPPASMLMTTSRSPMMPSVSQALKMIGYAIAARHQRFPEETPYNYRPHLQSGERYRWDEAARAAVQGYTRNDLVI